MKTPNALSSNNFRQFSLIALAAFGCAVSSPLLAQTDLPPLPPGASYTENGLLTASGGGGFQPDDSGPPGLPGGGSQGGGGSGGWPGEPTLPDYGYGFYLSIAFGPESNTVVITLHNTTNGLPYIIESSTNLLGPWYTNQSLLATNVSPNTNMVAQPIAIENYEGVYFRGLQAAPGELRWAVQLEDIATDTNQDAFGRGLDAAPSLSPDGQTVYITTAKRNISAIDATTGIIVWTDNIFSNNLSVPVQKPEFIGSAAVTASNLYVGSCDGNLYCLNATNGYTNWIKSMGAYTAVYATPSIDPSGRILVPSDETEDSRDGNPICGLTCLNPTNGAVEWFFLPQDMHNIPGSGNINNEGDIDSSVAVANNGTIYFLAEGWRLYSVDPTGKLNWFLPLQGDTEPDSSVAIDSFGRILVGSDSPYVACVNADGSLEWILNGDIVGGGGAPFGCSPTIDASNDVYVGSAILNSLSTGNLYSLDETGATNWVLTGSYNTCIMTSPAVGETKLYFALSPDTGYGDGDSVFYSMNLSNQTLTPFATNTQAILSSPLICPDGSVVYGCEDGWLYCYWGSSLPAGTNAPWPTFHQNNQRTGLQPGSAALATNNGAPFVCDGTNNGSGHFSFAIVGTNNGPWTVYSSTNLSNWISFQTGVNLSGTPPTNLITDTGVLNVPRKFYQLSNSLGVSKIIGFTSLNIVSGTNLVADQLYQVDDGVMRASGPYALGMPMNTLNALFDLYPWATAMNETKIYQWNGETFDAETNKGGNGLPPSWFTTGNISGGDMTILPGTSVVMYNPLSAYTIWFTGLVRNQQVISLQPGTNYLSASAPISGNVTNITGYVSHSGDIVKFWNTNSQSFVSHTNISGTWSNGGLTNIVSVGQGFVLISTNSYTWTNTW